jgi:hypothetical protein
LALHEVGLTHLSHGVVVAAIRHEFWIGPHVPEARLHESVRVQHVPATPLAGAGPGEPVALPTHSLPAPHETFRLFTPHPLGRLVPHWPAAARSATVLGMQHEPVTPLAGAALAPPVSVQVPVAHGQARLLAPQPFGRAVPHLPGYVAAHVFALQQVFVTLLQTPLAQVPQVTVEPHVSSNVPHWNAVKSAHVLALHGLPQTPFELQTSPAGQLPHWTASPVHALITEPQVLPTALHSSGVCFVSQRLAMPRTPQLSPFTQPKPGTPSQVTVPPQPSEIVPHSTPRLVFAAAQRTAALCGTQLGSQTWKRALQRRAAPPAPGVQLPQSVWLVGESSPQPSHAKPHS